MTDSKRIDRKDAEVLGTLTATVSMALDGLSDVDASSPTDGDALTWVDAHSAWEPVAGSGGTPTAITVVDESSDTQCYPAFFTAATGDLGPKTDATYLTYNASTGAFGATRFNAAADNQVLTSAADTTVTLDGTYSSDLVVSGTAVMYVLNLGTATAYANGKRFNITNGTPEFVGVVNTDGTVWHRVPPRAYCECVLLDNSTASGVWNSRVCESKDPGAGYSAVNEMGPLANAAAFVNQDGSAVQGAGAGTSAVWNSSATVDNYGYGALQCRTGTTTTGYCLGYSPAGGTPALGYMARAYTVRSWMSALSTVGDEYIARVGFGDNVTGGAHTHGVYFVYDRLTWGDVWVMRTINASGNTSTPTAVAPSIASTMQRLRIEMSSANTRADFWIGTTKVSGTGGLATYMPGSAVKGIVGITKSAGSTNTNISVDYIWNQAYPTVVR